MACAPGYQCLPDGEAVDLTLYLTDIDRWSHDHEQLLDRPKTAQ